MLNKLFVYGSLMAGIETSITRVLNEKASFWGEAKVKGSLYDLGSYPGLVYDPQSLDWVIGHVFEMKDIDFLLPFLDDYEASASGTEELEEYKREKIIVFGEGVRFPCWAYLYKMPIADFPIIESGNYLEYLKNNPNFQRFLDSV